MEKTNPSESINSLDAALAQVVSHETSKAPSPTEDQETGVGNGGEPGSASNQDNLASPVKPVAGDESESLETRENHPRPEEPSADASKDYSAEAKQMEAQVLDESQPGDVLESAYTEVAQDLGHSKEKADIHDNRSVDEMDDLEHKKIDGANIIEDDDDDEDVSLNALDSTSPTQERDEKPVQSESSREIEQRVIGAEILFERTPMDAHNGWDNLRWMSHNGARNVQSCDSVYRFVAGRKTLFWSGDHYLERRLAIYSEPSIILVLRAPENAAEVNTILDLPSGSKVADNPKSLIAYLVVESVIDPKTCKLCLSPLTTVTSIHEGVKHDDFRRRSCFEIITPAERVILSAIRLRRGAERALTSFTDSGAFVEVSSVEFKLRKAICSSHHQSDGIGPYSDLSWQHQVVLGTLHSIVISGNPKLLEQALLVAKTSVPKEDSVGSPNHLDSRIIDASDENGHTPLYYACKKRSSAAVASLVKFGANVNVRTKNRMTYIHICAQNLDDRSISALLSAEKPDLNVMDGLGRTAMYIAIVEGQSVGGKRDSEALDRCLTVLKSFGEGLMRESLYMHPLGILSSQWRADDARVVLKHTRFRFPLSSADRSSTGVSLSALYHYPIHLALVGLRKRIFAACTGNEDEIDDLRAAIAASESVFVSTLRVFLSRGFEPNERIEGILHPFDGADDLIEHYGLSPIQVLGAAALDACELKAAVDEQLFVDTLKLIMDAADLLVQSGARASLDAPPSSRSPTRTSETGFSSLHTIGNTPRKYFPIDRQNLKIISNKKLEILMDFERLDSSQTVWKSIQKVKSCNRSVIQRENKSTIDVSDAPGGNDDRTCAICWSAFGTVLNRRHRCRLTKRHICDACSSKRMSDHGEEYRISDGQFLLAQADETEVESMRLQAEKEKSMAIAARRSQAAARFDELERAERANRDSLFGNVMDGMAKAVFGDEEDLATRTSNDIGGLSSQLGQTRNMLNERGEKLSTLAEKSDKLVNASRDFASMARELNKKSSSFW